MKKYAFGVDIGGTTVKMGLFETMGTLLDTWEIPTRKQENGRYILPDIADAVDKKMEEKVEWLGWERVILLKVSV